MRRSLYVVIAGLLLATAAALLALAGSVPRSIDDAFIVLVYARHLAKSGSIYWNVEDGPVDGFTSMLDMLLKALSIRLFPEDPIRNAHVLTIAFHVAGVLTGGLVAYGLSLERTKRLPTLALATATLATVALGANSALATAASYELESPLYVFLVMLTFAITSFAAPSPVGHWALVAAAAGLVLVRPEGLVLASVFGVAWASRWLREAPRESARLTLRPLVVPSLTFASFVVAYVGWHLWRFGFVAPNTYYAKASDSRWNEIVDGWRYVVAFARQSPGKALMLALVPWAPALGFVRRAWKDDSAMHAYRAAMCATLIAILGVIGSGGDGYPGGRFLAVPSALFLVGLAAAGAGLGGFWRWAPVSILAVLTMEDGAGVVTGLDARLRKLAAWPSSAEDYACERTVTRTLADHVRFVAQTDYQQLKYFADELHVEDLMGLNDRARAHRPSPGPTLWGKGGIDDAPASGAEVIQIGIRSVGGQPSAFHRTDEVLTDPELARRFVGVPVVSETAAALARSYVPLSVAACGGFLNVFVRKDVASRFRGIAHVGHGSP